MVVTRSKAKLERVVEARCSFEEHRKQFETEARINVSDELCEIHVLITIEYGYIFYDGCMHSSCYALGRTGDQIVAAVGPIESTEQKFWELCTNVLIISSRLQDSDFNFVKLAIPPFVQMHHLGDSFPYAEFNIYVQTLFQDRGFELVMVKNSYVFIPFLCLSNEHAEGHLFVIGANKSLHYCSLTTDIKDVQSLLLQNE